MSRFFVCQDCKAENRSEHLACLACKSTNVIEYRDAKSYHALVRAAARLMGSRWDLTDDDYQDRL